MKDEQRKLIDWLDKFMLSDHLMLKDVLHHVLGELLSYFSRRNVDADVSGVMHWLLPDENKLHTLVAIGYLEDIIPPRVDQFDTFSGYVIQQNKNVVAIDIPSSNFFSNLLLQDPQDNTTQSAIGILLNANNLVEKGVVYLCSNHPYNFTDEDVEFLSSIAPYIANIIINTQKRELTIRFRYQRLINRHVVKADNFDKLSETVVYELQRYFIDKGITIEASILLYYDQSELKYLVGSERPTSFSSDVNDIQNKEIKYAISCSETLIIDDGNPETSAQILAPIPSQKIAGESIGIVCISAKIPRSLTHIDVQFCEEVAAQLSLAKEMTDLRRDRQLRSEAIGTVGYMDWMQHAVYHQVSQSLNTITNYSGIVRRQLQKQENIETNTKVYETLTIAANGIYEQNKVLGSEVTFYREMFGEIFEDFRILIVRHEIEIAAEQALNFLAELNTKTTLTIRIDCPESYRVHANSKLTSIFREIMINAGKYAGKKDCLLEITTSVIEKNLHIYFTDNGYGINPDKIEQIFVPRTRLPETSELAEGTGIGLAHARLVLRSWRGNLTAESEGIGKGTQFTIKLELIAGTGKLNWR